MSCETVQEHLTSYLLRDLPTAEAADVQQHLDHCAACRAAASELEQALDLLHSGLTVVPAGTPVRLDDTRRQAILLEPTKRLAGWELVMFRQVLPLAASLVVVIGVIFVWVKSSRQPVVEPRLPAATAPAAQPAPVPAGSGTHQTTAAEVAGPAPVTPMPAAPVLAADAIERADVSAKKKKDASIVTAREKMMHDEKSVAAPHKLAEVREAARRTVAAPAAVKSEAAAEEREAAADGVLWRKSAAKADQLADVQPGLSIGAVAGRATANEPVPAASAAPASAPAAAALPPVFKETVAKPRTAPAEPADADAFAFGTPEREQQAKANGIAEEGKVRLRKVAPDAAAAAGGGGGGGGKTRRRRRDGNSRLRSRAGRAGFRHASNRWSSCSLCREPGES